MSVGQLLAAVTAFGTMALITATVWDGGDKVQAKIATMDQAKVSAKVADFSKDLKSAPFRAPGTNTNNWNSVQGINQFQEGTHHMWYTPQFLDSYNKQINQYIYNTPLMDQSIEVDLRTKHRNRTTYISDLSNPIGTVQAGIVSTNGLDRFYVGGYQDPTNDFVPVKNFNRGVY